MQKFLSLAALLLIGLTNLGCDNNNQKLTLANRANNENNQRLSLEDFESFDTLNGIIWECGRWFSISDSHGTQGGKALKVELIPSNRPIFRVFSQGKEWTPYRWFMIDVYNANSVDAPLTIRFIDKDSNSDPAQFYTKVCNLFPGQNQVRIPISEIRTGPEKRNLKLHKIDKVAFLLFGNRKSYTLFFDNLYLTKQ